MNVQAYFTYAPNSIDNKIVYLYIEVIYREIN